MSDITLKITIDPTGAIKATEGIERSVNNLGNSLSNVKSHVSILDDTFAKIGLRMQGFINLSQAISNTFGTLIRGSNYGEEAVASLSQALSQQGLYSEQTVKELSDYAAQLQNITGIDDDLTVKTMAQLTAMGLQGEQLKQATALAQDLGAVMGTDMQAAARVMADAFNGNIGMLGKYIKGLDEADIKQRGAVSIIEQFTKSVGGQAEALGNTGAGSLKKFSAALDDLKQSLGDIIKDTIAPFVVVLKNMINWVNSMGSSFKALAIGLVASATAFALVNTSMGALPIVLGVITTAITAFMSALKNGEPLVAGIAAAVGTLTIALVALNAKLILTSSTITTLILPALNALRLAIASNPWILLISAVVGAGVALYGFIASQSKANEEIRDTARAAEEAKIGFDKLQTLGKIELSTKLAEAKLQVKLLKNELADASVQASAFTRTPLLAWFGMFAPATNANISEIEGNIEAWENYINKIESVIRANEKEASSSRNLAKVELELNKLKIQAMLEGREKRIAEINNEFEIEKAKLAERKDLVGKYATDMEKALEKVRDAKLKSVGDDIAKKEREQLNESQKIYSEYLDKKRDLDLQYQLASATSEDDKYIIQKTVLEKRINDLKSYGVLSADQDTELQRNEIALLQLNNNEKEKIQDKAKAAKLRIKELEIQSTANANEREIKDVENRYQLEIDAAKDNTALVTALEKARDQEISTIRKRQRDEALGANEFYKTLQASLISGFNTGWDSIIDASMTGAEKWKAIWTSMKQAAWNAIGSVVQKFIEGKLAELFITKTVEVGKTAATIAGETARTGATQAGVLARLAAVGSEIIGSLAGAAASIVTAIANAVRWVFTTIPFPFSLAVAGGAVAAIGGLYSSIKSAFGFEQGGVFKKGQRGFIEGTKTEIIQPEEDFISYLNKKIIPTIVNTTRIITMQQPAVAYAGGGNEALLRELRDFKKIMKQKDFKISINGTLNGQTFAREEFPKAERFRKSVLK